MQALKLRVTFDAVTGDHMSDGLIADYVDNRLAEFATGHMTEVTVGNGTMVDEFRFRILKGEIHWQQICFVFAGKEIQPNEFAVMDWPLGFADFSNNQISKILRLQSKLKRKIDSK